MPARKISIAVLSPRLSPLVFKASRLPFAFEKLRVDQKAVDNADAVCAATEPFPRGYGFLVDQLHLAPLQLRQHREGNGRFTRPDRRNFFGIARGSVPECVPLLELAL